MQDAPLIGVVLAAGDGSRMGGPKALLRLGGTLLAVEHARRLRASGCRRVVVVVSPPARAIVAEALAGDGLVDVVAATTSSQAESLAVALALLDEHGARPLVVVTPVDLLPAEATTIDRLVAAIRSSRGALDAATPTFGGRGGHPVVARLGVLRDDGVDPARPLRDRLRALDRRRARIAVDDPAVTGDFDVPDDLPVRRLGVGARGAG
ncbi:MAG: NTP transferase domain-containing protein [Labilithrix sp.]|nr:NTP transferase domain-containing protein [Labilithrix sp.]MCW5816846.1 NTP transferase domain-containing protein [Labilithrix sp.]